MSADTTVVVADDHAIFTESSQLQYSRGSIDVGGTEGSLTLRQEQTATYVGRLSQVIVNTQTLTFSGSLTGGVIAGTLSFREDRQSPLYRFVGSFTTPVTLR